MKPMATYLFLDIETSGLPGRKHGEVRIIELCMLAIKRTHLLKIDPDEEPRIQYKLKMCFNPEKILEPTSAKKTGLNKTLLKHEAEFNTDVFNAINSFISCLEQPVCLIGHNAIKFHFPILKYHFNTMNLSLPDYVMCTDSLYAFYDILEGINSENTFPKVMDVKVPLPGPRKYENLWREWFHNGRYSTESYKLKDIYERVGEGSHLEANNAENKCIMIMRIAIAKTGEFIEWVEQNHCPFSEIYEAEM